MRTADSDYYVYVLFRETGAPLWIGYGRRQRWTQHEAQARFGKEGMLYDAIRDMLLRGVEMPRIKLHEGLTKEMSYAYEIVLIQTIGRHPHGPLANKVERGHAGPLADTLAALHANNLGRTRPAEAAEKSRLFHLGRKRTDEMRHNMSIAAHTRKRRVVTDEMRRNMSIAALDRKPRTIR